MAGASKGLQSALARSTSGAVIALAEMSAEQLLGGLSDDQKAGLSALMANAGAAPGAKPAKADKGSESDPNEAEPDGDPDDGKKCATCGEVKKNGKCQCDLGTAGKSDARVKVVANAVANDENCKGKADLALSMLADDDFASLSGAAMVKLLGKTPVTGAAAAVDDSDPDEAARAEMKAAIAETGNSSIDANAGTSKPNPEVAAASVWDKAYASVGITTRN